ncbi:MAG: HIT family protein [Candidatus Aenigmarchaeota archaeon]|nr:HIT family protein [Candidatus Aenigmarchaeota archaeon]
MSTIDIDNMNVDDVGTNVNVSAPQPTTANQPPQECIFCAIVSGKMPAKIVESNEQFIAFLDIQPKAVGHIVIVPKRHVMIMDMMNADEQIAYDAMLKALILKQRNALGATGYTIISSNGGSSGQSVPHFSVHLIPTYSKTQVELPIMGLIQPQKVPEFVMDDVLKKLQ